MSDQICVVLIMPFIRMGDSILKKKFRIEQDSKDIDLNSPSLVTGLMKQLQGSYFEAQDPVQLLTGENIADFQLPASHSLKSKLISVLSKSLEATNRFPTNVEASHVLGIIRLLFLCCI